MSLLALCVSAAGAFVVTNIILVLLSNYQAQKFFKLKTPSLPVVPNPSILSGHYFNITTNRKNLQVLADWHRKLGPTFGFFNVDRPWVSTTDIELLKRIYVDEAQKHLDRENLRMPFADFNHSIFQVNGDKWRNSRRAVTPALSSVNLRSPEILSDLDGLIEQLRAGIDHRMVKVKSEVKGEIDENSNEPVEISSMVMRADDMFQRLAVSVIFLITYKRENLIDFKVEHDEWVTNLLSAARQIINPLTIMSSFFPFMRSTIDNAINLHPLGKMKAKIIGYVHEVAKMNREARKKHAEEQQQQVQEGKSAVQFSEVQQTETFKRRLIDGIVDAVVEKKIEYQQFVGNSLFLLLSGYITTADTLTCFVWHLARKPKIQENLRKSIRSEGADSEYLQWCFKETVRLHPAVPLGVGRVLGEDVHHKGQLLPKGCFVMPSTYTIHRDPKIWPEPERFWPERWQKSADFHPAAFMGFGLGPRNCVGYRLATLEIKLAIQMLLTNYRIETCDETPNEFNFSSPALLFTIPDEPIKVRLVKLDTEVNAA